MRPCSQLSLLQFSPQVWQALSSLFPVAVYSLLALLTPQSPRWLVSRGLSHEARSCLQKLRKSDYNINRELQEYEDACSETMGPSGSRWTKVHCVERLWNRRVDAVLGHSLVHSLVR